MSIKNNITREMYKYSCVEKEKIFTADADYFVALKTSDLWLDDNNLFIEVTLSNIQKAYLKISLYDEDIFSINFFQKQLNKNRYFDKTFLKFNKLKIDYENNSEKILITLKNKTKIEIIKKQFCLKIIDKQGNIKTQTSLRAGWDHLEGFASPPLGFKEDNNDFFPFVSFQLDSEELIYGLGEKFNNFVKNGTQSVIYNVDNAATSNGDLAYAGVPLVYSTNNWGMLINTGHKTEWEIGSPITETLSVLSHEQNLEMVFFVGDSIKELISKYTFLTGRIKGVPDDAYGIWINRLYYHNKEELFTEIKNAKKFNYPVDVFTLDPKWLKNRFTKTCNFEFNDEAFGEIETLFKEVKKQNSKLCFWINPYLQIDNSETWKEVFENNYYTKKKDGSIAHIWCGLNFYQETATAVDLTNPKAVIWWKNKIKNLLKKGLGFIKPDYGDSIDADALLWNGEIGKDFRNSYIELYIKYSYEAMEEVFGKSKAFVLSRPGYIGTQQYPGKWAGDSATSFNELKMQLWSGLSNSLCGTVMWGTDIGGFSTLEHMNHIDLYARWSQFGMMTPFSRYHGFGAREPWYYGERDLNISKKFAVQKRKLIPFYKMCEYEAIKTGVPILRPLVLEYQDDFIARKIDDQYLLGQEIMVAPILSDKKYNRQVYFPKGKWININNKQIFEGNRIYDVACPIDEMLIFIKDGSVVPMFKNDELNLSDLNHQQIKLLKFGEPTKKNIIFMVGEKNHNIDLKKLDDKTYEIEVM